jgi:GT2 family glycosyltransferase
VYDTEARWLRKAIESVRDQVYPHWELCIVDDGSSRDHVREILSEYASSDPRIKTLASPVNRHVAAASNLALSIAGGEYVAFLDHDDELNPDALFEVARRLAQEPEADLVYTDECTISPGGETLLNDYKPDWSPDTLLSHMFVGHLLVLRRSLVEELGGFRTGYEGAQDFDLVLRAARRGAKVAHVRKVLYRWRAVPTSVAGCADAKPYADAAARRALRDHLEASRVDAAVEAGRQPFTYRVRYRVRDPVPVAILTGTTSGGPGIDLAAILAKTRHRPCHVYVVHDREGPRGASKIEGASFDGVPVVPLACPGLRLTAQALAAVEEEAVLLLSDGFQPGTEDWLSALIEHAQRPEIGAVGTRVPDDRGPLAPGLRGLLAQTIHNPPELGSACLLTRRALLRSYGEARTPGIMTRGEDAAFCRFVRASGYRLVYTPYAEGERPAVR